MEVVRPVFVFYEEDEVWMDDLEKLLGVFYGVEREIYCYVCNCVVFADFVA